MKQFKIIIEKHTDGYVAYPLNLKGVVVGQGDTYEEALADVKSAIRFHIETFGPEAIDPDPSVIEAFVAVRGHPAAVIIGFTDEDDWLEDSLLKDEKFLARVSESRQQYEEGKYKTLEELP